MLLCLCPVGCLSLAFFLPSQRNFPIPFKPKVAIANFIGKILKKKYGIMKRGLDTMPLFLLDDLLNSNIQKMEDFFKMFWSSQNI